MSKEGFIWAHIVHPGPEVRGGNKRQLITLHLIKTKREVNAGADGFFRLSFICSLGLQYIRWSHSHSLQLNISVRIPKIKLRGISYMSPNPVKLMVTITDHLVLIDKCSYSPFKMVLDDLGFEERKIYVMPPGYS